MRPYFFLVLCCLFVGGCQPAERLNGGGSSFIYPAMLKWSRVYAAERGIQIDYQSTGSGNGIQQMTVQTLNFGCTDAPMNKDQLGVAEGRGGAVVHLPLVMGGVVPVYNLPNLPPDTILNFSGQVLAGIFLGDIKSWDDPKIAELNPGVKLPQQRILVVSRSDPSGTTAIFADYVSKVAPEPWKAKDMGKPGTAVRWPAGEAQKGNEGVAGLVTRVPGSLGYVELKYALDLNLEYGAIRNRAGKFLRASPESVQKAAAAALTKIPENLCFSLTDAPGEESYPIAGTTWAVFYAKQRPVVADPMLEFFRWAIDPSGGQHYARELGYAPLPENLIAATRARLDSLAGGAKK
ncbi:MAG: phosphate ABC transporter substrate-binding protein PstS [Gemmataceae bacterium]